MNKRLRWIIILIAIILLTLLIASFPRLQTSTFVALHGVEIERSVASGKGIPDGMDGTLWSGKHDMVEFILLSWGDTYYGCYLSPDNVPLAFQNIDLPLTQDGNELWTWRADGDNHGMTYRICDNWFFFEASF